MATEGTNKNLRNQYFVSLFGDLEVVCQLRRLTKSPKISSLLAGTRKWGQLKEIEYTSLKIEFKLT